MRETFESEWAELKKILKVHKRIKLDRAGYLSTDEICQKFETNKHNLSALRMRHDDFPKSAKISRKDNNFYFSKKAMTDWLLKHRLEFKRKRAGSLERKISLSKVINKFARIDIMIVKNG